MKIWNASENKKKRRQKRKKINKMEAESKKTETMNKNEDEKENERLVKRKAIENKYKNGIVYIPPLCERRISRNRKTLRRVYQVEYRWL